MFHITVDYNEEDSINIIQDPVSFIDCLIF